MARRPPPTAISLRIAGIIAPLLNRVYDNLGRANHLVSLYHDLYGKGKGRRAVHKADLLRAAVVFLHATFEDYLRTLSGIYLPTANAKALDDIPLAGIGENKRPEKFLLGALAQHRGKSVDQLIDESISCYLLRTNYNDTTEVASLLTSLSIPLYDSLKDTFPRLQGLMDRRHQIVHCADRLEGKAPGRQRADSISVRQVDSWIAAIRDFVSTITAHIIDREFEGMYGIDLDKVEQLDKLLKARKTGSEQAAEGL